MCCRSTFNICIFYYYGAVMEFLLLTWGWIESSSSQLQVLIILSIFILALLICIYVYKKYVRKKKVEQLKRCEIKHQVLRVNQEYLNILLEWKVVLPEAYDVVYRKLLMCDNDVDAEKYKIALKLLSTYEDKQKQVEEYYQLLMKDFNHDLTCLKMLEDQYNKYKDHVEELIEVKACVIACKKIE